MLTVEFIFLSQSDSRISDSTAQLTATPRRLFFRLLRLRLRIRHEEEEENSSSVYKDDTAAEEDEDADEDDDDCYLRSRNLELGARTIKREREWKGKK